MNRTIRADILPATTVAGHALEGASCALCAQIRGERGGDLIARLLPGMPYERRVFFETAEFAAIPSLGALAPGHTLLCPKQHLCSFARLGPDARRDYARARPGLRRLLAAMYRMPVHLFEHGMADHGARMVCTVDHAHLHLLPVACAFSPEADPNFRWSRWEGTSELLLDHLRGREYLLYESDDGAMYFCTAGESDIPSQYLRQVFARLIGRPDAWDWRTHPTPAATRDVWARTRARLASPFALTGVRPWTTPAS